MAEKITVKGKGDLGFHPGLRVEIKKDEEYTIDAEDFADQLFERPSPEWRAPWEREPAEAAPVESAPAEGKKKKGGAE